MRGTFRSALVVGWVLLLAYAWSPTPTTTSYTSRSASLAFPRQPIHDRKSLVAATGSSSRSERSRIFSVPDQADAPSSSFDSVASTSVDDVDVVEIKGLDYDMDTFQRWNGMHRLLLELSQQIPVLLTVPLTPESAQKTYSENVRLLVGGGGTKEDDGAELVSSRDELVNLNQALDLLVQASTRVSNFWSGSSGSSSSRDRMDGSSSSSSPYLPPRIQCKLGVKARNLTAIQAIWQVDLSAPLGVAAAAAAPFSSSSASTNQLQGRSVLEVDPETQTVLTHRLLQVQWNGQEQDASAIGTFLSGSRQAVLTLQKAPFLQPLLSSPLLTQVRDEWIQQQVSSSDESSQRQAPGKDELSPLFVVVPRTNNTTTTTSKKDDEVWIPVDDYEAPFPGSQRRWPAHVARQEAIRTFCHQIIPALSNEQESNVEQLKSYFAPHARLYSSDGSVLLQDRSRLANFYHSLAAGRERSFGSWTLERIQVLEDEDDKVATKGSNNRTTNDLEQPPRRPRIQIEYSTSNQIPGTGAPVLAHGCDIYTIVPPSSSSSSDPGNDASSRLLIEKVEQTKFSIGQQDGVWLMRTLATAVETGRFTRTTEDDSSFWMDIWKRVSQQQSSGSSKGKSSTAKSRKTLSLPRRSDRAAIVVYRIMEGLNSQLRGLVEPSSPLNAAAPVNEFMSDNIRLVGPFDETLLRGLSAYNRNVGLAISSLRAGIRSGGILSEKDPTVVVELTQQGNVRCSLTLHLKMVAPGLPGMMSSGRLNSGGAAGLPLKLGLVSEYSLCAETGRILKHGLVESRVNGQLTPGDVVSRWIQRFSSPDGGGSGGSGIDDLSESWRKTILDTVGWFRSLSGDR